ncbi:Argininosuccinate lyase [Bienertia sinuspersici]
MDLYTGWLPAAVACSPDSVVFSLAPLSARRSCRLPFTDICQLPAFILRRRPAAALRLTHRGITDPKTQALIGEYENPVYQLQQVVNASSWSKPLCHEHLGLISGNWTYGEYDKKMAEYKDKGIDKDPNEVYFEAVGGRKKGLIPGLGSAGDLYYEKPSSRADKAEWERERLEVEKERYQKEQEQQEEVRKISEYLVEVQKTMQGYSQMFSQCGGSFPFTHPRDPPDSTKGRAPCAS